MTDFGWFVFTVAVAAVGGYVGKKLKIPAGVMIVSMVFVAVLNAGFEKAYSYSWLSNVIQILAGVLIGGKMTREAVAELKTVIRPTIVLVCCMVVLNVCASLLIITFSPLDLTTAMFASAPGGLTDMTIMSGDFGANSAYVAIIQVCRQLAIYMFMPAIIRAVNVKEPMGVKVQPTGKKEDISHEKQIRHFLTVLVIATIGSVIFVRLHISGGWIIGAMIVSAIYCATGHSYVFPKWMRNSLQVLTGVFTGMKMTRDVIRMLPVLGVPILCVMVCIVIFAVGIGTILYKISDMDHTTCMLASTPGGMSEMALLSDELGADTVKMATIQTVRMFCVVLFFPPLTSLIMHVFGLQ